MSVPADARMEIKFAAYDVHLATLLKWVAAHPAKFRQPYPDRKVNNVYFDTYNLDAYAQNLSGASARVKVRYRWYGESCAPSKGTLEVKCRRNYYGWKKLYKCSDFTASKSDDWLQMRKKLLSQLPAEGRIWLDAYATPVLINRYHRQYFVSQDEKIRVTVDTDQAVWDQRRKGIPNYDLKANLARSLVVEVKFSRHDRQLASSTIQSMPLRVSRHSKYINGVRAITGY